MDRLGRLWLGLLAVSALACNAFDDAGAAGPAPALDPVRPPQLVSTPPPTVAPPPVHMTNPPQPRPVTPTPGIPMRAPDERPVAVATTPPPPIDGGSLLVTADGQFAVAADADRDRIMVVDMAERAIAHEVMLAAGALPGRLTEDGEGRVHVLLRGEGEVATLDPAVGEIVANAPVCNLPRGIAYRASTDSLLVACGGGELHELAPESGEIRGTLTLEPDLRDVVITEQDRVFVSLFKRAELLEVDAQGAVMSRRTPRTLVGPFSSEGFGPPPPPSGFEDEVTKQHLEPAVAWSSMAVPGGGVAMVHQRAQTDEVDISHDSNEGGGYGGGGLSCEAIVQSSVTLMGPDGEVQSLPPVASLVLPVDGALSPDGRWMAIAAAGTTFGGFAPGKPGASPGVLVFDMRAPMSETDCLMPGITLPGGSAPVDQGIAVAFDSDGRLLVQTREPAELHVYWDVDRCGFGGQCEPEFVVPLRGAPMRDTGHELFHRDAGRGVACASCHPGGGDDGRTWLFSEIGPRRTQLFTMGIAGTEPLHWDGDMPTLGILMEEVFVSRMGGQPQSPERVDAMATWIENLETLPPPRNTDDPAVARGKALFESEAVGCASCHNGALLTNNESFDVGTGGAFQVPSLVNVVYHQPYIHTGCAQTLHDRFDPACGGGDKHGKTSHLAPAEIDDLVAYLESL